MLRREVSREIDPLSLMMVYLVVHRARRFEPVDCEQSRACFEAWAPMMPSFRTTGIGSAVGPF
jgi:hypothetical protein